MAVPTKILLATDGSNDATLATRAAVDLSNKTGAELHVVHVWRTMPSTRFADFIRTELEREAQELLAKQVEDIESSGGTIAKVYLKKGSPVDEILDSIDESSVNLVVIGSRGLGPVKRLALGSVSEGIAHLATCPVLVLRGGEDAWPPENIIAGNDGSKPAEYASELAINLGGLFGSRVLLVRAYPRLPEMDLEGRALDPRLVEDELRHEERNLSKRAVEIEKNTGIRSRIRMDAGDPASALLDAAEEHAPERTLIAVGSRGLGPGQRLRLGSVSTRVLRAAGGPVLISPPEYR